MKKSYLLLIISLLLMISSCKHQQSLTANDFTPKISAINTFYAYKIPATKKLFSWSRNMSENVDLRDLHKLNSYKILSNNVSAQPIIDNNTLYILDEKSNLYSFDVANIPKLKWKLALLQDNKTYGGGGIIYRSARLYVTNGSKYLFIIDAKNGTNVSVKAFDEIIKSKPMVESDIAYIQDIHNNIYAYDFKKDFFKWGIHNSSAEIINIYTREMIEGWDGIIALSNTGLLSKIDKTKGVVLWQQDLFQSSQRSQNVAIKDFTNSGLIKDGNIYVSHGSGKLYKVDFKTGNIEFNIDLPNIQNMNIIGNLIFIVNSGNQVVAISPTSGKIVWSQDIFTKEIDNIAVIMQPQVFSNQLLILTNKGVLVILDPMTGKKISAITINQDASFFAVNNARLFIFSDKSVQISE